MAAFPFSRRDMRMESTFLRGIRGTAPHITQDTTHQYPTRICTFGRRRPCTLPHGSGFRPALSRKFGLFGPVVAAGVPPEGDFAVGKERLDRQTGVRTQIGLTEQAVDGPGLNARLKHSARIHQPAHLWLVDDDVEAGRGRQVTRVDRAVPEVERRPAELRPSDSSPARWPPVRAALRCSFAAPRSL